MLTRMWLSPAVVVLLLLASPARERLSAEEIDPRDLQREVLARQALQSDRQLAPLFLGVRVRNRVATLSGPVPTPDLAQHAVNVLRRLPELSDVRSNLIVQFDQPTILPPPGTAAAPPAQQVALWFPMRAETPQRQDVFKPNLPALPPATPIAETVSRPKETKPALPADAPAIGNAVQDLILGDERYRRVRYEVKQGKVYLSGAVVRWGDLYELSLAVARIPGVEAVVLRDVRAEPRK